MAEDDRLIEVIREMERLSAVVSRLGSQVEGLDRDAVRELATLTARSETEATFRGLIMSWTSLSEKVGELSSDIHGAHGIERRLEDTRLCLFGRGGENGLRSTIRVHRWGFRVVGALIILILGDKFGLYKLASII